MTINYNSNVILLQGKRNIHDGLYDIPITNIQPDNCILPPCIANITHKPVLPPSMSPPKAQPTSKPKKLNKYNEYNINNITSTLLNTTIKQYLNSDTSTVTPITIVSPSLNVIIRKDTTKRDLVKFLHAACCSPVPSTWIKAIKKNHFATWPGLTAELVTKYLPPTIATAKGHLKQERQGLQSTKQPPSFDESSFPLPTNNKKTNDLVLLLSDQHTFTKAYLDLTGKFPVQSSRGNNYILVVYYHDANAILVQPLKNRNSPTIMDAWQSIYQRLQQAGVAPNLWILDNECSTDLKETFTKQQITWQRVPPH